MNERFDPKENRPVEPAAWAAEQATPRMDPLNPQPAAKEFSATDARAGRTGWPVLIVLLAGLVLALLVWLPAEFAADTTDTDIQPAQSEQTTTPPADGTTTPDTAVTPPAATDTQTPATATQPAPATGDAQPDTMGTTPQDTAPQTNGATPQTTP